VSTGVFTVRITFSATLPRSARAIPRRPWVPMTMRSACVSSATARISSHATPSLRIAVSWTPRDARAWIAASSPFRAASAIRVATSTVATSAPSGNPMTGISYECMTDTLASSLKARSIAKSSALSDVSVKSMGTRTFLIASILEVSSPTAVFARNPWPASLEFEPSAQARRVLDARRAGQLKTKTSFPPSSSTVTCPPFSSFPKRSSSPRGRFISSWITRASGRAPKSGS
jgi:hypothetical protein